MISSQVLLFLVGFTANLSLLEAMNYQTYYQSRLQSGNGCDSYTCGTNAKCTMSNGRPVCSCLNLYAGDPLVHCRRVDCQDSCGINANCELRGDVAVCSCPKDMTGDPFVRCRPFTPEDLCKPNPCGENAICTPGHDNTGKERPVCTCITGYVGNALTSCRRGECQSDNECPYNRACIDYYCQDPCTGKECAVTAKCEARRHIAVCTCPDGSRGDAVVGCAISSSRYGSGRYLRESPKK